MDKFMIIDQLNTSQFKKLMGLFEQVNWMRSEEDMAIVLKNSISIGIVESETQELIGYARVLSDTIKCAFIFDVVVDEKYRKKGLGNMLMNSIITHPKLERIKIFELTCAPETMPFYKRFLFSEVYHSDEFGIVKPLRYKRN